MEMLHYEAARVGPPFKQRGAVRPEVNSHLHKWTAKGLSSTAGSATISNVRSDLRGFQPLRLLAGQLRVVYLERRLRGGLSWRTLNGFAM
jgi:hypothetical protein